MTIVIPGEPKTTAQQKGFSFAAHVKGRVRGKNHLGWYTKAAVKAEGQRYRGYILQQKPHGPPLEGPLTCTVTFVFPLSQALARKHADQISNFDFELPYFPKGRHDADNLAKLLFDVLTDTQVWSDDGVVSDLIIRKRCGSFPRIVVEIETYVPPDPIAHAVDV